MPELSQKRLFQLASLAALGGWSVLILLPTWSQGPRLVLGVAVVLLCVLYGVSLFQALTSRGERSMGKPGFFTLRGVLALFSNPRAVLAAWVHILAFDLLVGLYIQQQGAAQGIGHLWLVPCYLLAMMFGPLGLLLFLGIGFLHGL
jgi:heme A synthase